MKLEDRLAYLESIGYSLTPQDLKNNSKKTVVVGMSGGVDSSVCAVICKLLGYKTIGIFMKNWDELDESGKCTSEDDYSDVEKVCQQIDIPYYSLNFVKEYEENVFSHFVREYKKGFTPNPDILCNREIKFKAFYEKVRGLGGDYLATGHYCQIIEESGVKFLAKGKDRNKDQSYFLYAIKGAVLEHVLFPIGHMEKSLVRKIANDFNLVTSTKKDSTGICFIGERNFKNFLSQYINSQKGEFVHLDSNKVMGKHDGSCFYTIGQRKGLGLGGPGGPWFVAKKDLETNTVFVVEGEEHPALYSKDLVASDLTWIQAENIQLPLRCKAKVRYRQNDQWCTLKKEDSGYKVQFDDPQRAVAVRQSVVFYNGEKCLGGGIISKPGLSYFDQGIPLP